MISRLLHLQHLDGILTGLIRYRLPLNTLSEYPEPWFWKISGSERERTWQFQCSEKNTRHGEETVRDKNRVQELLLSFFHPIPLPCLGLVFFRTLKLTSPLFLSSWNFSGSGIWILTKGVNWQPVPGHPDQIPSKCWGRSNLMISHLMKVSVEQPRLHQVLVIIVLKRLRMGQLDFNRAWPH